MILICFSYYRVEDLAPIDGNVNAEKQPKILDHHLILIYSTYIFI